MYKDDSLTLHTDLYQINMMQVYFNQGIHNKNAVFEVYFRQLPFKNGFAVFAGLVTYCTRCLAGRLAGCLALTASTFFYSVL